MEKIFFIFLISILIIKTIISKTIAKIPFKFYPTNIFFPNQTHPLTKRYMSQIVIEIPIGTPPQTLNLSLNLNSFHSLLLNNNLPNIELSSIYNKSASETYNCTDSKKYYLYEDFGEAEIFNDEIYLSNNNKGKIFNFILVYGLGFNVPNEFYAPGMIGLRLKNENNYFHKDENRFLYQLRKYELIDTEVFYFNFDANNIENNLLNDDGILVIGEDLFDDDENFLKIKTGYLYMPTLKTEWSFNFDSVYYGNNEIKESKDALIKTENGLILGPTEYENIIKQFFINSTKCYSNTTKMGYATYRYYYCNKDFDENTIEDLKFVLTSINFSFIFTGKDLFFEENEIKYFNIIFLRQNNIYWYLGRTFLHKYRLRFDTDRKLIYIPLKNELNNDINSDSSDADIKEEDNISFYQKDIFWIILALSIFAIGLVIFIFVCLKKYPRKKRTNEIEDDGDYDYKNTDDNIGIN